jgi:ribonuclease BN (tRNA processing enzyme)
LQEKIMKIIFLGTGGARFVTITQVRATGGWVLELAGEMIHIDPGPGALVRAKQYGVNLQKLTGMVISHAHPDHATDAPLVLEAMTQGAFKKKGAVIANEIVFKGAEEFLPVFSSYHLKAIGRQEIMEPGRKISLGKIRIEAIRAVHPEPKSLGYVFSGEGRKVGYTGDGEYYGGQEDHFQGCDYLLVNCHHPRGIKYKGFMNAEEARRLIEGAKPGMAVLTHFGMRMMRGVAEREAGWIQEQTGIKTIAARDGMVIDSESGDQGKMGKSLADF